MQFLKFLITLLLLLIILPAVAQKQTNIEGIYSGIPWYDQNGNVVSAHGANIVKEGNKFYLFGEAHINSGNDFAGFNCYSSSDLYNWKFENVALTVQQEGMLGPKSVGERPKVLKCSKTGEYVMLMHADSLDYKHQCVGYATSQNIEGPYEFKGPILYKGQPIRKWDMGSFQDDDGSGYLIIHSGLLYKLSDDYKSIAEEVVDNKWHGSESPTIFKKDGIYFWLASDLTSWERNDNFYYTATSLKGPWTARGNFAPAGTLTWNSQTSFVLPITGSKETTYLFMGDRWSYPYHATSATYVWQPLTVSGTTLSIPQYQEAWKINITTGKSSPLSLEGKTINHADKTIAYTGKWQQVATDALASGRSDISGDSFSIKFNGTQAGFYGILGTDCGYARVVVTDANGKEVANGLVDMYSKYRHKALMYLSPIFTKGTYTLTVSVVGFHGSWTDKKKVIYGSTGNYIAVNSIIINK